MNNHILAGKNVVVQGITGSQGSFHTQAMLTAGTNIVGGTSPNKAGQSVHGVPVFSKLSDINQPIDATVVFVPAAHAKAAILEAIDSEVPLIVTITEGVPVHDMLYVKKHLKNSPSVMIGPNSPGILLPGVHKLGIIPKDMSLPGSVGIVSRSGTLTYEAMAGLTNKGIGQRYVIGIGGDPVKGTGFIETLRLFQDDPLVDVIVMIGEIGGTEEVEAAEFIKHGVTKPVVAYVAGHHAPVGVQLGHAGAILGNHQESAQSKTESLKNAGAITTQSIVELINEVVKLKG